MAVVMGGMKGEEGAQYYLRYHDHGEEIYDLDKFTSKQQATLALQSKEESIKGGCQCGGVQFTLLRPKESEGKHEACLCMCRSCRLSFGQPLTAWAMRIPFDRVYTEEGSVHDGSLFGTLCRYQSSELATRDFCGKCGASVFFHTIDRPGKVDIAFGLLQAPEGMRGSSWFEWDDDGVHFPEDAVDKDLLEMVKANYYKLKISDKLES
ncbi:hypothetical protein PV11_00601 [Exophiala sideris]|uniref:CENP-V/GFA domain-containing protein n=1 Tax=Exophiala sideris TaxID=1016849 RepID=A0A0D1ZDH6_9EURO|nr:hypothetical protein PV11_00601 [Exophiala sideris]